MEAKYLFIVAIALILAAMIVSVVCIAKQGMNYLLVFNVLILMLALCLLVIGMNKSIPDVNTFINSLYSTPVGEAVDGGESAINTEMEE